MMPERDALIAMLPEHSLLAGIVVLILLEVFGVRKVWPTWIAIAATGAAAVIAFRLASMEGAWHLFDGQLVVDGGALHAKGALLALAVPVLLMAKSEFSDGEFSILLLSSLYGLCIAVSSQNFLPLFLGLELASLPVYALVLLAYRRPQSAEAALKYLVLSGAATATLLMGVSLLYGATGSMGVSDFVLAVQGGEGFSQIAVILVFVALFLKAAVVPFHSWAPDAYEGASVPVTAYMSTLMKGAVVIVAATLVALVPVTGPLAELLYVLPLASIVWGNLAAIRQNSFRRMIAYSSIAHAGYLFYAIPGSPFARRSAVLFYVVTYAVANLLAFAVLPRHEHDEKRDDLENLRGLYLRDPVAAMLIAIAMLSLAGLPPLPGFVAKFYIFRNLIAAGHTTYAVLGLLGSYLGVYFYLRVIVRMFMAERTAVWSEPRWNEQRADGMAQTAGWLCLAATVLLTVVPGWVIAQF
jgi:NADH-quinone oxidoreductase subunit N